VPAVLPLLHYRHEVGTDTSRSPGYGREVDEAAKVLERLRRIDELDRDTTPPTRLLGELRELVREAEAWARLEGDERARSAVEKLREEAEGMS
jgi:hypothetical protein